MRFKSMSQSDRHMLLSSVKFVELQTAGVVFVVSLFFLLGYDGS